MPRAVVIVLALMGCVACRRGADGPSDSLLVQVRTELATRGKLDQDVRVGFGEGGQVDTAQVRRMMATDSSNTAWLKAWVQMWKWPTSKQVGRENVENAFLIVQHAVHDTAFMRAMLPMIEASARSGDLKPGDVAMLSDRLEVKAGHKQKYGTQFTITDGRLVLDPIADSAQVDARRKAIGLGTLAEYVRMADSAMKMPPPQ